MSITSLLHIQRHAPDRAVSYKLCSRRADGTMEAHPQRHSVPLTTAPPNYLPAGRYSVLYYDALENVLPPIAPCSVVLGPSERQLGERQLNQHGRQQAEHAFGRKGLAVASTNATEQARATEHVEDGAAQQGHGESGGLPIGPAMAEAFQREQLRDLQQARQHRHETHTQEIQARQRAHSLHLDDLGRNLEYVGEMRRQVVDSQRLVSESNWDGLTMLRAMQQSLLDQVQVSRRIQTEHMAMLEQYSQRLQAAARPPPDYVPLMTEGIKMLERLLMSCASQEPRARWLDAAAGLAQPMGGSPQSQSATEMLELLPEETVAELRQLLVGDAAEKAAQGANAGTHPPPSKEVSNRNATPPAPPQSEFSDKQKAAIAKMLETWAPGRTSRKHSDKADAED